MPNPNPPHPAVRHHFSLRGLFILVTVAGLLIGALNWLREHLKWIGERHEAMQDFREVHLSGPLTPIGLPAGFPVSLAILGERAVPYIWLHDREMEHERLEEIRSLFPEAEVHPGRKADRHTD